QPEDDRARTAIVPVDAPRNDAGRSAGDADRTRADDPGCPRGRDEHATDDQGNPKDKDLLPVMHMALLMMGFRREDANRARRLHRWISSPDRNRQGRRRGCRRAGDSARRTPARPTLAAGSCRRPCSAAARRKGYTFGARSFVLPTTSVRTPADRALPGKDVTEPPVRDSSETAVVRCGGPCLAG